jgi:hypothetical protein
MRTAVDSGLPGVNLAPGDHLCGFFFGIAERDEVLLPYLRAGLRSGEKCMCIVDATEPEHVFDGLDAQLDDMHEPKSKPYVESEQLGVISASQAYLRTGEFSTPDMIEFLQDFTSTATGVEGYDTVRIAGETTWLLKQPPGAEQFIDYESELNRFVPLYPQVVFCLYDLQRFGGGMIVDVLRTHPKVLLGGMVLENPNYLSPDEFRAMRS